MPALSRKQSGTVIVVALIIVVVVTALVGVTFLATNAATRMGGRAKDYIATQRAAEAAVEYGYGIWKKRIFSFGRSLTTAEASANLTGPALTGFAYASTAGNGPLTISATDEYGAPTATATRVMVNLADYPGWRGFASSYLVSAKVQAVGNLGSLETAGVRRRFQYIEVPLFQSMYFYEHSIDFFVPPTMTVTGLVHTNDSFSAVASSLNGALTFTGNISYVNNYSQETTTPAFQSYQYYNIYPTSTWLPLVFPNGGESAQVTKVTRYEPMGLSLATVFNTTDSNPNNDGYHELIEIPVTGAGITDPPEIASRRLYNKAGLVVSITGTTATVTAKNGTTVNASGIAKLTGAFAGKTTMYDKREGKTVDVANIDVSKLTTALQSTDVAGFNGVLYLVDVTPVTTSGSSPSPNPKTIRLQNGGVLPSGGLSIASQNPVYVQGDYNTGTTSSPTAVPANATGNPNNTDSPTAPGYTRKPAAIMADAVMFLSNSWNDSLATSAASPMPPASSTTYNVALMAGFMPYGYQPPVGASYGWSGGAQNFGRFLESWSGSTCTYFGSMVELFQSTTFTGRWDQSYFSAPKRRYNYDPNFSITPPPGGSDAVLYTRGAWSKY